MNKQRYVLKYFPSDDEFIIFDTENHNKIIAATFEYDGAKLIQQSAVTIRRIMLGINNEITEQYLIDAAKYGYDFHKNSQFPQHEFKDACINNFAQYRQFKKQIPDHYCEIEWYSNKIKIVSIQ